MNFEGLFYVTAFISANSRFFILTYNYDIKGRNLNLHLKVETDAKNGLVRNQAIKKIHNFDPIVMKLGENDQHIT